MSPPPPRSTLFPYTTLFRSALIDAARARDHGASATLIGGASPGGYVRQRLADSGLARVAPTGASHLDRKSTRLNSSHVAISYAVFCLKKKKSTHIDTL